MSKMPVSLRLASDRIRNQEADELVKRAEYVRSLSADDYAVSFEAVDPEDTCSNPTCSQEVFDRAARVAAKLRNHSASSIRSVRFEPYPSKSDGYWRISVSFKRSESYPYTGAEWYVSDEELWKAWEEDGK
jgi:hypothetical protein